MSSICHWREEKFSERKVAEMLNYSFVLDSNGNQLSPTLETKAWYMIRKKKATLVSKYPMVIQLKRSIPEDEICKDEIRCGIDDGSKYVGIALVQKCKTHNKVLFKGTIEHRNDVHNLMADRLIFRRFRRRNKRYRPARRNNRSASLRKGKIYPTILQKKQAIVRAIKQLKKWINFTNIYLEDVAITDLQPSTVDITPWTIKPMRRQNKATIAEYKGFKHRDLIKYTPKGKPPVIGYITAISPKRNSLNFRSSKKVHTRVSINSCTLLWRFSKIYWIPEGVFS